MTTCRELYVELLSLTKGFLTQEYQTSEKIFSESETYHFFRTFAEKRQEKKAPPYIKASATVPALPDAAQPLPIREEVKSVVPQTLKNLPLSKAILSEKIENSAPVEKTSKTTKKSEEKENKEGKEKSILTLELPSALKMQDLAEIRKIVEKKHPHLHLLDQIPDDAEAKRIAARWKEDKKQQQIIILAFDEIPSHLTLLENIAKALEARGVRTQVVNAIKMEHNQGWDELLQSQELKLAIASSSGFHHLRGLQKYYREDTKQGAHFLGSQRLLLLADLSFYFKEPSLKQSLWNTLKQLLADLFSS